jgi:hypothetical protein
MTPCAPVGDDPNDRPALVAADAETACERSHRGTLPWSQIPFVTRTWIALSVAAEHPETARCAQAETERRMKKRCVDYAAGMCCPHPQASR